MQMVTNDQAKTVTISEFDPVLFKKAKIPASYTVILSPVVDSALLQNIGRSISYAQQTTYAVQRNGDGGIVSSPVVSWVQQLSPIS